MRKNAENEVGGDKSNVQWHDIANEENRRFGSNKISEFEVRTNKYKSGNRVRVQMISLSGQKMCVAYYVHIYVLFPHTYKKDTEEVYCSIKMILLVVIII